MWLRAALGVGLSGMLSIACGGAGGSPSAHQEPQSEKNATDPAAAPAPSPSPSEEQPAKKEEPGAKATASISASPSCAPIGSRVVLKLGMTADHRSVDCYDVDRVSVVFAPQKQADVSVMGPMSDGFCAIDVEVPKGAESGKIRVEVGPDAFETDAAFPVPCP